MERTWLKAQSSKLKVENESLHPIPPLWGEGKGEGDAMRYALCPKPIKEC